MLLGVMGAVCLLIFLYALAALYREQTKLHDLKVRVHDLRREYAERLARQRGEEILVVEAEDEAPAGDAPVGTIQTPSERPRAAA